MLHRSRNSEREFAGWNQLPCGPVLTPNISCTKLKIYSAYADSPIVPKLFFVLYYLCQKIGFRTIICFTDQKNAGIEFAEWNQVPCGPVLAPKIS